MMYYIPFSFFKQKGRLVWPLDTPLNLPHAGGMKSSSSDESSCLPWSLKVYTRLFISSTVIDTKYNMILFEITVLQIFSWF